MCRNGSPPLKRGPTPPTEKQPLTGEQSNFEALRDELPRRVAAAFPATGKRGRHRGPTADTVWKAVFARYCRREGYSIAEIARGVAQQEGRRLPYTPAAVEKWEQRLRELEAAEGLPTPELHIDPLKVQAAAFARREQVGLAEREDEWAAADSEERNGRPGKGRGREPLGHALTWLARSAGAARSPADAQRERSRAIRAHTKRQRARERAIDAARSPLADAIPADPGAELSELIAEQRLESGGAAESVGWDEVIGPALGHLRDARYDPLKHDRDQPDGRRRRHGAGPC